MSNSYRIQSKENWSGGGTPIEQVNAGSLQRIADAIEIMAQNYLRLQSDRDFYERRYKEELADNQRMYRRMCSLKGVITRQKKEFKRLKENNLQQ